MNSIFKSFAALVFLVIGVSQAAADEYTMPSKWDGAYGGLTAGWSINSNDIYYKAETGNPLDYSKTETYSEAFLAGLLGYNRQFGRYVVGVEADIGLMLGDGYSGAVPDPAPSTTVRSDRVDTKWLSHVRARVGVPVASDTILLYGAAGIAIAQIDYEHTATTPMMNGNGNGNGNGNDITFGGSKTLTGLSLGAGAEVALNSRTFTRLEYTWDHFGKERYDWGGGRYNEYDHDIHTISVTIGMRF